MLTKLLVFVINVSPTLRRFIWRWWYSKLARQIQAERWTFMNYGYAPASTGGPGLNLNAPDEPDRLCIQLYDHVASPCDLHGKDVLEVGSGRGGGASYFARYREPAKMTGIDFSPQAVAFCRDRHKGVANLHFQTGDAENLPFADASFDAVINVESSHCYGDIRRFFAEVCRVLRPGGWFLYADFREAADVQTLEANLAREKWKVIEKKEITGNVLKALELDNARKRDLISALVPARLQSVFGEFAGLTGGKVQQSFLRGDLKYLRFACQKVAA